MTSQSIIQEGQRGTGAELRFVNTSLLALASGQPSQPTEARLARVQLHVRCTPECFPGWDEQTESTPRILDVPMAHISLFQACPLLRCREPKQGLPRARCQPETSN